MLRLNRSPRQDKKIKKEKILAIRILPDSPTIRHLCSNLDPPSANPSSQTMNTIDCGTSTTTLCSIKSSNNNSDHNLVSHVTNTVNTNMTEGTSSLPNNSNSQSSAPENNNNTTNNITNNTTNNITTPASTNITSNSSTTTILPQNLQKDQNFNQKSAMLSDIFAFGVTAIIIHNPAGVYRKIKSFAKKSKNKVKLKYNNNYDVADYFSRITMRKNARDEITNNDNFKEMVNICCVDRDLTLTTKKLLKHPAIAGIPSLKLLACKSLIGLHEDKGNLDVFVAPIMDEKKVIITYNSKILEGGCRKGKKLTIISTKGVKRILRTNLEKKHVAKFIK